jgi:predicted enzyme related to lactoylglutathione lyase
MDIKYVHTNLVAKDWKKLSEFYIKVFHCVPKPPERALSGEWLDNLTGIKNARIGGIHLLLPGCKENEPTLEIFQYGKNEKNVRKTINLEGYGHIAFAVSNVDTCLEEVKKAWGSSGRRHGKYGSGGSRKIACCLSERPGREYYRNTKMGLNFFPYR